MTPSRFVDDDSSDALSISSSSADSFGDLCPVLTPLAGREVKFVHARIAWEHHATMLVHEQQFHLKYRMAFELYESE